VASTERLEAGQDDPMAQRFSAPIPEQGEAPADEQVRADAPEQTSSAERVVPQPVTEHPLVVYNGAETIHGQRFEPANPEPVEVMVAPGFIETAKAVGPFNQALAEQGHTVMVLDKPRFGRRGEAMQLTEAERLEQFMEEARRIAETVRSQGLEQVDLVGHSMGSIETMLAAFMIEAETPGTVRSLVLLNPAAVDGTTTVSGLIRQAAVETGQELLSSMRKGRAGLKQFAGSVIESLKYAKNLPRSVAEMRAIAQADIRQGLEKLTASGVKTAIIAGDEDELFKVERLAGTVEPAEAGRLVQIDGKYETFNSENPSHRESERYDTKPGRISPKMVNGFYTVEGTHNDTQLDSERTARLVSLVLDNLNH
jgi:alpha-beta hydrolase superfamily lysophospholipase